jgi:hypothetical protein
VQKEKPVGAKKKYVGAKKRGCPKWAASFINA